MRDFGRAIPFIGRQRELVLSVARLQAAERGEGSALFLAGEPGIGKTRLLQELSQRAGDRGRRVPPYLNEIAAALVVTPGTVEQHLVRTYTKIGVRRRAEATAYAIRHDLAAPSPQPPVVQ